MDHCRSNLLLLAFVLTVTTTFDTFAIGISVNTQDLIERADVIVIGKVISKTGQEMDWTARNYDDTVNTYKEIVTAYQIESSRVLKGAISESKFIFYGFGGIVGDTQSEWSFGFDFEPDDLLLVFLRRDDLNNAWTVVAQSQGIYELESVNGLFQVKRSTTDAHIVQGGKTSLETHQREQTIQLEKLINGDEK